MDLNDSLPEYAAPQDSNGKAIRVVDLDAMMNDLEQRGWISFGNGLVKMLYSPDDPELSMWVNLKSREEYFSPKLLKMIEQKILPQR